MTKKSASAGARLPQDLAHWPAPPAVTPEAAAAAARDAAVVASSKYRRLSLEGDTTGLATSIFCWANTQEVLHVKSTAKSHANGIFL